MVSARLWSLHLFWSLKHIGQVVKKKDSVTSVEQEKLEFTGTGGTHQMDSYLLSTLMTLMTYRYNWGSLSQSLNPHLD
jgi:alpha-galactosidase